MMETMVIELFELQMNWMLSYSYVPFTELFTTDILIMITCENRITVSVISAIRLPRYCRPRSHKATLIVATASAAGVTLDRRAAPRLGSNAVPT